LISGIIGIIASALILGFGVVVAGIFGTICGVVLVFGIFALLRGIFAIKREKFSLAVVGGIFAILCGGILGILGLIFIIRGREEFT
jgi:hypothetical protein